MPKEWKNGELVDVSETEPTEVAPPKEPKTKKEKAPKEFPAVSPPEEPKEEERSFHLNAD